MIKPPNLNLNLNNILHMIHNLLSIVFFILLVIGIMIFLSSGFILAFLVLNWSAITSRVKHSTKQLRKKLHCVRVRLAKKLFAAIAYVQTLFAIIQEEYSHSREIAVVRCINCLVLARISADASPCKELAKLRQDIPELLNDLRQLRKHITDDDLFDLVQTKMSDLKFQLGCALTLADSRTISTHTRRLLEEQLYEANTAINGSVPLIAMA